MFKFAVVAAAGVEAVRVQRQDPTAEEMSCLAKGKYWRLTNKNGWQCKKGPASSFVQDPTAEEMSCLAKGKYWRLTNKNGWQCKKGPASSFVQRGGIETSECECDPRDEQCKVACDCESAAQGQEWHLDDGECVIEGH